MSVESGKDWGGTGALPDDGIVVRSNEELRSVVSDCRRSGKELPTVGLLGGDLCRTLGGRGDEGGLRSVSAPRVTVDIGAVLIDGRLHWFCAHLLVGSWWAGPLWVAAQAAHYGNWNIAPRSHPGDGLLDVLSGTLPLSERWLAWRRLPAGVHIPHPRINYNRIPAIQVGFPKPLPIRLDGETVGRASDLSVRLEVDALNLVL